VGRTCRNHKDSEAVSALSWSSIHKEHGLAAIENPYWQSMLLMIPGQMPATAMVLSRESKMSSWHPYATSKKMLQHFIGTVVHWCSDVGRIYWCSDVGHIYWCSDVGHIYWCSDVGHIYWCSDVGHIYWCSDVGHIYWCSDVGHIYWCSDVGHIYWCSDVGHTYHH